MKAQFLFTRAKCVQAEVGPVKRRALPTCQEKVPHQGPVRIRKGLHQRQRIHHLQHSRRKGDATSEGYPAATPALRPASGQEGEGENYACRLSIPDFSGMKNNRRCKSFEFHCCNATCKTHDASRSILYSTGKSGQVSQLILTWAPTPLSHPPPHQHTSHTLPMVWTVSTRCSVVMKS